jgi:hypothetical protein
MYVWAKFRQKKKKNQKFRNKVVLEVFNRQKGGGGRGSKNLQISIFGFQCLAKKIER